MTAPSIAYFDCISGASGDMILGAIIDAGLPVDTLRKRLADLHLEGFELDCESVQRQGFRAIKVDVRVVDNEAARSLSEIEGILNTSDLPSAIRDEATRIFRRLGDAEAEIHGTSTDRVHLHELGGLDTIVDVVGALVGLAELGVERIVCSPLPLGRGFVSGAHGQIPLPAPATLSLLREVPIVGSEIDAELVTPTGAALLSSLASTFGPLPPMSPAKVGYGAGSSDLPIPNVLRLILGNETEAAGRTDRSGRTVESMRVLETNLDDLNPEIFDHAMNRLFEAGARDVWLTPVQMKKNRPATLLRVLCAPSDVHAMADILFSETTTLGIRESSVVRTSLAREMRSVQTAFGEIRVKVTLDDESWARATPEYEDCRRLAEELGVPLRKIYRAAELAAGSLATGE
ncbi:MAG: nickel pincer cofactor biosynthesis protein LarC [Gemmatimonadetes bacterium]|nr:nickel pincer cofactor biosynthesis protein LarC [Gemmatimonadota bacterium]